MPGANPPMSTCRRSSPEDSAQWVSKTAKPVYIGDIAQKLRAKQVRRGADVPIPAGAENQIGNGRQQQQPHSDARAIIIDARNATAHKTGMPGVG